MTHDQIHKCLVLCALLPVYCLAGPHDPLAHGIDGALRTVAGSTWSIEDGVLAPERGDEHAYIATKAEYADVEIALEFNPDAGTNSGVFARCQEQEEINPQDCYEFNIWDEHPDQESRTGAIVLHSPPIAIVDTQDKWNSMRVRLEGTRLRVWINDTLTNDIQNDKLDQGFIALQYGGGNGMVKFRNMRIIALR